MITIIFDVKIDISMCEPDYVNLFFLWTSSIVHVFDFLTFDIFFDIWAIGRMGNGTHGQRDIMINTADRDGAPWGMGHMVKGISWLILQTEMGHLGEWNTWVIGHMGNGTHGQLST